MKPITTFVLAMAMATSAFGYGTILNGFDSGEAQPVSRTARDATFPSEKRAGVRIRNIFTSLYLRVQ